MCLGWAGGGAGNTWWEAIGKVMAVQEALCTSVLVLTLKSLTPLVEVGVGVGNT